MTVATGLNLFRLCCCASGCPSGTSGGWVVVSWFAGITLRCCSPAWKPVGPSGTAAAAAGQWAASRSESDVLRRCIASLQQSVRKVLHCRLANLLRSVHNCINVNIDSDTSTASLLLGPGVAVAQPLRLEAAASLAGLGLGFPVGCSDRVPLSQRPCTAVR